MEQRHASLRSPSTGTLALPRGRRVRGRGAWLAWILTGWAGAGWGQEALFESNGGTNTYYGWAVAHAGDVDHDGISDLLVGTSNAGAVVRSGWNHSVLWSLAPAEQDAVQEGRAVAGVGDVDLDAHDDLLVGDPQGGPEGRGRVRLFSGATGELLRQHEGAPGDAGFGGSVAGLGDVDGDAVADYAVGAFQAAGVAGRVRVYSGATGLELASMEGTAGDQLGRAVSFVGDYDMSGGCELAVSATGAPGGGRVDVVDLQGAVLLSVSAPASAELFGIRLAGGQDVDCDGVADLLVGDTGDDSAAVNAGAAHVISGQDGSFLASFYGEASADRAGQVAFAGDTDGDGRAEVLVGAQQANSNGGDAGTVWVYDVDSGEQLARWDGASGGDRLGNVAGLGDVTGDGLADVALGARAADNNAANTGQVDVRAGSSNVFTLLGSSTFSIGSGGVRELQLDAGPEYAGRTYVVLGSMTDGVLPMPLGPKLALPLIPDAYFVHTLIHPNQKPLSNGVGVLDEQGRASASFQLLVGQAAGLQGTVVRHAFVLLGELEIDFASPAVSLLLPL